MNYIKTQLTFLDYVLDNKVADIHLLITQQSNGGGGSHYQLIFYGQHSFSQTDTLQYNIKPNSTDFENRDLLVKYIQLGLIPFLSKTPAIESITIQLKEQTINNSTAPLETSKDPWNYWVYRLGINGNINGDAVYKGFHYNGNVSAGRVTDKSKISFGLSFGKNRDSYQFSDSSGATKILVKNENYDFSHQYVRSLSTHFSVGYDVGLSRSTFTNYKERILFRPAVEYDIFPYKDVNNKLFTIKYGVDITDNRYFDTTLYSKLQETLIGQEFDVALTYNQKWGTVNLSSNFHTYFTNFRFYNIGLGGGLNVRISGGLSFNVFLFGNVLRDQIYLPRGQASEQQILTRQRQLATNFSYFSYFGISYRFGSKLNNFVNPRFNGGSGNFSFSN